MADKIYENLDPREAELLKIEQRCRTLKTYTCVFMIATLVIYIFTVKVKIEIETCADTLKNHLAAAHDKRGKDADNNTCNNILDGQVSDVAPTKQATVSDPRKP